jgi:hypothetical protein
MTDGRIPPTDPILGELGVRLPPPDGRPPEVVRWSGLINPGPTVTRLHDVNDLRAYADVRNDDILAFHPKLAADVEYPAATSLFVAADTQVVEAYCPNAEHQMLAEALEALKKLFGHRPKCMNPPFSSRYE